MLFLTATPHSGDEEAFHNLLGLLHPDFKALQHLPEGDERRTLRERLAHYLVQRRRPDIARMAGRHHLSRPGDAGSDLSADRCLGPTVR